MTSSRVVLVPKSKNNNKSVRVRQYKASKRKWQRERVNARQYRAFVCGAATGRGGKDAWFDARTIIVSRALSQRRLLNVSAECDACLLRLHQYNEPMLLSRLPLVRRLELLYANRTVAQLLANLVLTKNFDVRQNVLDDLAFLNEWLLATFLRENRDLARLIRRYIGGCLLGCTNGSVCDPAGTVTLNYHYTERIEHLAWGPCFLCKPKLAAAYYVCCACECGCEYEYGWGHNDDTIDKEGSLAMEAQLSHLRRNHTFEQWNKKVCSVPSCFYLSRQWYDSMCDRCGEPVKNLGYDTYAPCDPHSKRRSQFATRFGGAGYYRPSHFVV
jgi:hypothetical protein